jgi:hypothetical protein
MAGQLEPAKMPPAPATPPRVDAEPDAPKPPPVVSPSDLPPDLYELWQERAGIRQFDGGLPREQAEALALTDVLGQADPPARNGNADAVEGVAVVQSALFAVDAFAGPYVRGF